jgi:hypothetical protein
MKVVRVTAGGAKPVSEHGLLPDDTVATAAVKLETMFGSKVYLWCYRRVDAHEALAISVAGSVHETNGAYDPSAVARELERRFSVKVTPSSASTPGKLLKKLQRQGAELLEPVAMRNRTVIPGGYFAADEANPYLDLRVDDISVRSRARPFNTGDLLLESFDADAVHATTRADLESARPPGVLPKAWSEGFVARYFPDVEDRQLIRWSREGERHLREQRKTSPDTIPILTYLPMTGGAPVGKVGIEALMNAFASEPATKHRPVIRIQGGGIDKPVVRVHETFSDEDVSRLKTPSKREWIQALFLGEKGSAVATVYPGGAYKLQIRFGYLEKATIDDAAAYFPPVNSFLAAVSPFIRPLDIKYVRPSSSSYIQKPHLLETPSVLAGPNNGVYQISTVRLSARCTLQDVEAIVSARGFPSLKAVNVHAGELHLQWIRSNALRKAAVVKNLLHRGALGPAAVEQLASQLGVSRRELAEIAETKFSRHAVITHAKVRVSSDTELTVYVNGNDPAYGERVHQALTNLLRSCGKGRSKGATDWSKAVSDSPDAIDTGITSASDLDEFYEFFDEDEDEDGGDGYGRADEAAPSSPSAPTLPGNANLLERLKQADPEVFAFPGQPGYTPYSMKCQKNRDNTKQPLVLTPAEAERATRDSTAAGLRAMHNKLEYRGLTYVCPEKWCPVSGVARGLNESCPDPDEPEWTMWSNNFPALQAGVSHPSGLCMPCCFGAKPKKGLKTWSVLKQCKEQAGEELPDVDEKVARIKAGHVNKADKLLEEGAYGYAPRELFPDGTDDAVVRRGMGDRSKATMARALAFLFGYGSERELLASVAASLGPHHFVQGDVREFMLEADAARAEKQGKAKVRAWMTPEYSGALSVDGASMTDAQAAREARIMLAHEECVRRLKTGEKVSDVSLFRFANSGALARNPVMLVTIDEAGNAFAEHLPERAMPSAGKVAAVMRRRGTAEPLGTKNKLGFDPWWDATGTWPKRVFSAVRSVVPQGATRVVSHAMMAVGTLTKTGGYLPYSRPVFVDPAYTHLRMSDVRRLTPASDADARQALDTTGDPFYRFAWRDVAEGAAADDRKDAALFAPVSEDERARTMARLNAKIDAANRIASEISDNVPADVFVARSGESARDRLKRAKREAGKALSTGVADEVLDYALESLFRPVQLGVPPIVKPGKGERIGHS